MAYNPLDAAGKVFKPARPLTTIVHLVSVCDWFAVLCVATFIASACTFKSDSWLSIWDTCVAVVSSIVLPFKRKLSSAPLTLPILRS